MLHWLRKQLERLIEAKRREAERRLEELKVRYHIFRALLDDNNRSVELITDLDLKLREANGPWPGFKGKVRELLERSGDLVEKLNRLDYDGHKALFTIHRRVSEQVQRLVDKVSVREDVPLCLPLDGVLPEFQGMVGGKASTLARLRALGRFNVPDGFVVLVHACRLFLEEGGLSFKILRRLQRYLHTAGEEIPEEVVREVKSEIMVTPLPETLEAALYEASLPFFEGGSEAGLAVRSSALGEDTREHSFAGQFTTVLNVVSYEELISAFKEVVASNFSARSLAYRINAGMKPLDFDMAVLCLKMIPARGAGILFTRDPNAPEADYMLVSAVYGLGELAVAGGSMTDLYQPSRKGGDPAAPPVIARKSGSSGK